MNDSTNALAVANNSMLSTNLFGGEGTTQTKRVTSLNLNNEVDSDILLNSLDNIDFRLNDEVESDIPVKGYIITERTTEAVDEVSGEVYNKKDYTTILVDTNNQTHVTGSNAFYYSLVNIIAFKGVPSEDNVIIIRPIKVEAKEKGHSFLKAKYIKKGE